MKHGQDDAADCEECGENPEKDALKVSDHSAQAKYHPAAVLFSARIPRIRRWSPTRFATYLRAGILLIRIPVAKVVAPMAIAAYVGAVIGILIAAVTGWRQLYRLRLGAPRDA